MARMDDVVAQKQIRKELNRRHIDLSGTNIEVFQGVVYIKGRIRAMPDPSSQDSFLSSLKKTVRRIPNIKDVILDKVLVLQ